MRKLFLVLTFSILYFGFTFGQEFGIAPPNLNFGSVPLGSNAMLQATVNNPGTSDLVISSITSSDGQFTFSPNTFPITILAGNNQVFDITFTPSAVGSNTDSLIFTHNASGSPTSYSVQGTGVTPNFSITPPNLNFGSVPLGSNAMLQATVNNPGTSDLVISSITSSDGQFTFSPNTFPITILAGNNQVFDITFTPSAVGSNTDSLIFTHNASGSPTSYSVQGTGVTPNFSITPPNLNFGSVPLGSNAMLQATVNNPGTSDLVISSITSSDGQFTFSPNTFPITILAGNNQVFDITFTPSAVGSNTDSLIFTHNASGSPTSYSVQGTGVTPNFGITPPNLNFGSVPLGSNAMLQATVNNPGTSDLVISSITSSDGQFTFSPNTFPITILAGNNQVFDITFTPSAVGSNTDSLIFTHNASGSPTSYSVQGTGVTPNFSITPPNLNFGSVPLGSNAMLQATVNNPGTSDLVISSITSSDGQFTFSPNTFPITILAGNNQVFDITFTPSAVGSNTDSLIFTHNASGSPTSYSVQGTGVTPNFGITPPNLNFGSVPLGSNAMLQATVNNPGTSDLVISSITSSDGQFTFSPNTFPITILAGNNQVFDITFTPSAVGSNTDSLIFTHNASGSPTSYSVQGTGVTPNFGITPPNLNFGSVPLGSNAMLQATVNNPGTSDLVISSITSSDAQFTFSPNVFPITILAGGNQLFDITFTPSAVGSNTDSLIFTHNASGSPTSYSVQGTGVTPNFGITPPNLNFGNVSLGSNSTLQATVNNPGTSDLVISNITSSDGQFSFSPNTFPVTILAGNNQVFDIIFTPSAVGSNIDSLVFTHNASGSPTSYSVQGTGVTPGFGISPPNLSFGSVSLGSNSTLQTTVTNTGTSDLVISSITSSDAQFTFSPNTFPITILAGGNQVFDITFTPSAVGSNIDSLVFTHNASGSPTSYSVQGTGVTPNFGITPPNLNFGNVSLGSNSTLQATVNNPGTSDLVISNITSSDGQFSFSPNTFPVTILAGNNQVFDIIFTPSAVGSNIDSLVFTHNASGSPTSYSVQGTGVTPGFGISPPNLSFGSVSLGSNSTLQTTVTNTGTSDLVISSITSSDAQFTFSPNTFPITILAGNNQVFDIIFTPSAVGSNIDSLVFTHNASGSPTSYSVQGTGVTPGFGISPPNLSFGSVSLGSNSTLQTTVTNTGTSDLVISSITSSDAQFTFSPNTFPITILAGNNQVFDIIFTPSAVGSNIDSLVFTHNASGSPTSYSVQGTGVTPGFGISPPNLSFGSVSLGSNSTLQTTVTNTGTSDLVISSITSSDAQFTFSPNTFPITILAGNNQVFDITFTPSAVGSNIDSLVFTHNASGSPTSYSVQGTGVTPNFGITPPNLNFGSVPLGSNAMLQATVNNPGTSDLVISNITSSDGQFTFSPNIFPITILAGNNQVFDITFTPSAVGSNIDSLVFTHNASGSPTSYSVQGTGVTPNFGITPPNLNFGSVPLGSNAMLQATVNNPGTSDLVISNITSSDGQFTFSPNIFPITILAGNNQVFDITFTPSAVGINLDSLIFTHNASGSPTSYSVQGIGVDAIEPSIQVVNLVNIIIGSTTDVPITITNNSTTPLLVDANINAGSNWNISPDTVTIPAGGNFLYTLTFIAPAIPNTFTGTLVFSAASVPSQTIPLSAIVVSEAGLIFEKDSVLRLEDNSYLDVMQLKSLTDSLHALQFRLQVNKKVGDNVILSFQNIQKGSDVSDSSWILLYNVERGPITPNGASKDEVFVLLYNINQGVGLIPGDYNELFKVNYRVADLPALQDSLKSTFKITNVEASTYQGAAIDITPSHDEFVVIARNRVGALGDVNRDGCIDILDLLMVTDHIVSIDSLDAVEFLRADIAPWPPGNPSAEPDGFVNVQDLSVIQSIILTEMFPDGTPLGPCGYVMLSKLNGDEDAKVTLFINNDGISAYIDSKVAIRAAQIEFSNVGSDPEDMLISTDLGQGYFYYAPADKILRTLMYDPLGEKYIEAGEHFIADMPFILSSPEEVALDKLILVDVTRKKLTKIQVEIIFGSPVLPLDYMLFQNYPNPFNPSTTIEFSLPEDVSNARLTIYNALGERVAELVNSSLSAGNYAYQWNANNVATGMYIYELRTDNYVSIKKMVLVK